MLKISHAPITWENPKSIKAWINEHASTFWVAMLRRADFKKVRSILKPDCRKYHQAHHRRQLGMRSMIGRLLSGKKVCFRLLKASDGKHHKKSNWIEKIITKVADKAAKKNSLAALPSQG